MLEYNVLLKRENKLLYLLSFKEVYFMARVLKSAERVKYLVIRLPSQIKRVQEAGLQILEELEQL